MSHLLDERARLSPPALAVSRVKRVRLGEEQLGLGALGISSSHRLLGGLAVRVDVIEGPSDSVAAVLAT